VSLLTSAATRRVGGCGLTAASGTPRVHAVIHREMQGIRWVLQPGFAPQLEAVLRSSGQMVKESPLKRVTVHQVGPDRFYVKRYLHHGVLLRPLKYLFAPTQAHQEWVLAQQLEARNIPVVRHVALGERHSWTGIHESVLITEAFPGLPLDQAPGVDPARVLAFVNRLHEHGVLQRDLHPANLLVRKDPFEIRLVDLHGAEVRDALLDSERTANLAMLRVSYPIPVSAEVEEESARLRRTLLFRRSWRCLRHNRDFAARAAGGLLWQVRSAGLTPTALAIMDDPDGFLAQRAQILKGGRTATVGKTDSVVLKRFNFRKVENLVKDLFRHSRARRAFRAAYHLELAGISTAKVLAVASRRCCGVLLRSYLLMAEIPAALDLGARLRRGPAPEPALIRKTAELIAQLHQQGFSHRDLKETNLVLDGEQRLYLLDLDGLKFHGEVPENRVVADLMRLARGLAAFPIVTVQHRILFLLAYCRARRLKRVPHEL
jgi:tRNA A-37 threonylcarbamoyl transferase component Bud32